MGLSNQHKATKLATLLKKEQQLFEQYLGLLGQERFAITKFQPEQVLLCSGKREKLIEELQSIRRMREELLFDNNIAGETDRQTPLMQIVKNMFTYQESEQILPLVARLKQIVNVVRTAELELKQILNFSMNMVCGAASLLWSGTQNVNKGYTRLGVLAESFNPSMVVSPVLRKA